VELQCPFEKPILGAFAGCSQSSRVAVGERLGVVCASAVACQNCHTLLALLREHARFALKVADPKAVLPFGKEMKIMLGGLRGLRHALEPGASDAAIDDIHQTVVRAQESFGSLTALPFSEIVRAIASIRPRDR
jgi:hypothetical protein